MRELIKKILILALWLLAVSSTSYATPLYTQDVYCDGEKCGAMEIDQYAAYARSTDWMGGVTIDGQFLPQYPYEYHYIQSINLYDDPTPKTYIDGSTLPVPLIDTPPGGYEADFFDYYLYYDEDEFPTFYDQPSTYMIDAKTEDDKKLQMSFETWLVCIIDEEFGLYPKQAKDDTYTFATLLGWTWGYTISYSLVDGLDLYTSTRDDLKWINTPSTDWSTALTQSYGYSPAIDWFNADTGSCENCVVPEPSSLLLLGGGLASLAFVVRRKKKKS